MKYLYIILAILLIAGGAYYYYFKTAKPAQAPVTENSRIESNNNGNAEQAAPDLASATPQAASGQENPEPSRQDPAAGQPAQGVFSSGDEGDLGADIAVVEVVYTDTAFSPSPIDVKAGDYVIFKNNSNTNFWPASDPNFVQSQYPGFDAGKAIAPGGRYQFQFLEPGTLKYYDQLNPEATGVVKVSK
ncbi:MAG: cupredoxin domain-containing protein [Patescibacteria group bacterium]|nr:cupredoxin domain-containing protein [Patescibacteria group bacterium]